MTPLEQRFAKVARALAAELAPTRAIAEGRFLQVQAATSLEVLAQVRTSTAFAARFDAQALSSGLQLDWGHRAKGSREQMWEVTPARFVCVLEGRNISERPWKLASTSVSRWKTLA